MKQLNGLKKVIRKIMKKLSLVLILILSLHSWTKADDISNLQIEGMSIGDSLLDYFSDEFIKKSLIEDYPKSDTYKRIQLLKYKSFKTYDAMHIVYKKDDKKKIIQSINGMKNYINEIDNCLRKKKIIFNEIINLVDNFEITDEGKRKHDYDKSGKSFTYRKIIEFINGDRIEIACYDWSKKKKFRDHLRVGIHKRDFVYWLNNKAY